MKIKINNKEYDGVYNNKQELIIKLSDDLDKIFFIEWAELSLSGVHKNYYTKDVDFEKFHHIGTLKSCYPVLNIKKDSVILKYAYYTIK